MSSEFEHGFESLPGGTADFVDMTDLFEAAAAGMHESLLRSTSVLTSALRAEMYDEELVFTHNFELQDAMTAFEVRLAVFTVLRPVLNRKPSQIGEVRMDSGVLAPANPDAPAFDPLAPLLPDEVCWLLDRSFACEVCTCCTPPFATPHIALNNNTDGVAPRHDSFPECTHSTARPSGPSSC
jgi:hypothetical protein